MLREIGLLHYSIPQTTGVSFVLSSLVMLFLTCTGHFGDVSLALHALPGVVVFLAPAFVGVFLAVAFVVIVVSMVCDSVADSNERRR